MSSSSDSSRQRQLDLLRIVCCVAWADGDVSASERQLLERLVAHYFLASDEEGESLLAAARQLAAWSQDLSLLEELVPRLELAEDRLLALKLSYQIARSDRRSPDEPCINPEEKRAYRRLVELCDLPEQQVREVEWAAERERVEQRSPWDLLTSAFAGLGAWPRPDSLDRLGIGGF
ncbi:MAG: TerB family tellurite resistance protein [Cyanobium sp.]